MTAMTVPPPGWIPIGARELQSSARRHLRRALLLSSLGHVSFLALLLWAQARHPEIEGRLFEEPIRVLPIPNLPPLLPPPASPDHAAVTPSNKDGTLVLTERRIQVDADTPPYIPPVSAGGGVSSGDAQRRDAKAGPEVNVVQGEPGENDFVPHETEPKPTFHPDPDYPEWARDAGIQGRVLLHVLVGADGHVRRVVILENVIGLGDAAAKGISRWVFLPARSNGNPVAVWVTIPVHYFLQP
jgi:protein TonB